MQTVMDEKVAPLLAWREGVDGQVADHEARLKRLEERPVFSLGPSSAAGGPGRGGSPPSRSSWSTRGSETTNESVEHEPKYLEFKGWCSWDERLTKGVEKSAFLDFFAELKTHMPASYSEMLGTPKFFGLRNVKVHVPVRTGTAGELRGIVRDAITIGNLELGGVTPKVMCEDSPSARARKSAMGRMMDACRSLGLTRGLAACAVAPDWPGSAVSVGSGGNEPVLVARISPTGQPLVDMEACRAVFGVAGGELERAFVAARRA
jgi:hypothetical protein